MTGARTKRKGLREALAAKKVRTWHYPIPITESEVVDPLSEALQIARQQAFRANLGTDQKAKDEAAAKVTAAKAALDACFWIVDLQGLRSGADFNALVNAYPATEEQKAADPEAEMDLDGFHVALLMASIVDGEGMTEAEWREALWSDRWTKADRDQLFSTVRLANERGFSDGISFE